MSNSMTWQLLGRVAPSGLSDARIQAHWASQLLAAAADSYAPHADDDSHTNLGWVDSLRALVGRPLGMQGAVHVGIRIEDLTILLVAEDFELLGEIPLAGRGLQWGRRELSRALPSHIGTKGPRELVLRDYDMPEHPVSGDGHFDLSESAAFVELRRWYANTATVLTDLSEGTSGASDVRCWPHHLDLATLITLAGSAADGKAKTIGVGMTPGDGNYGEPYWYVTPYPYPEDPVLGELAGGGKWHREGWLGAVLVGAAALDGVAGESAQHDRVSSFLRTAIDACRRMLGDH